ncbi:hypothetical protein NGRA_1638 [Nosema granulosis]|uniref:Uncharacterized protein n=1 Tax=Nosema granulosis TaxID=83296 RepID=A0A9P6GZ45_9MICR|nr:hypothetical protein NGRA_1638 [Nosema granulosis]
MNLDNTMHKNEERKDVLRVPLVEGQREIIYNEIDDNGIADDVINIIEYTISSSNDANKFNIIVEALSPLIQDKAKLIVSKLYLFKRRPCKFNNNCKDPKCIFIHDNDKIFRNQDNKRKVEPEEAKRSRCDVGSHRSQEVILNRVDGSKHSEADLIDGVSRFGEIESVKKLNDIKWLIVFKDSESAKNLVNSRDVILGDGNIKKYYNVMENMKKYELNSLLDKQEDIINRLNITNNPDVEELKRIISRVKVLVKEVEGSTNGHEQKRTQAINFNN